MSYGSPYHTHCVSHPPTIPYSKFKPTHNLTHAPPAIEEGREFRGQMGDVAEFSLSSLSISSCSAIASDVLHTEG